MSEPIQAFPPHVLERFWSKVAIGGADDCWPWLAGKYGNGYGAFSLNGRLMRAHRFAYEITHGPMPPGSVGRHKCDNRPCCNPDHVLPGTHAQNMADRSERGRQARGERVSTSKLSAAAIAAIRIDPRGARPVAREYGVARSMVQRIRQRKAWAHV